MKSILFIIISIVILILAIITINCNLEIFDTTKIKKNLKILENDYNYFQKFLNSKKINSLINNNKLNTYKEKKNKILFITFDNRSNQKYLEIHNKNINNYVEKFGYEYKYYANCDKNVYWCKIHMVLDELKTNKYDYVVWLDSDTIIKNFNIDIGNIFNMFSSDIFVGSDNNIKFDIINAGIFAISNSDNGINFLNDCLKYINEDCLNSNKTLKGTWAASCYEQGVMNLLIHDKYYSFTTVLSNKIFFNYFICSDDVFLMHLYASTPKSRVKCFTRKNSS